jgi:succinate dehydrogenase/fumarate reductase flavoprotein subunit
LPGSPAPLPGNGSAPQKEAVKKEDAKNGATARPPSAVCATLTKIREVMWQNVGIMRNGKELTAAIKQLEAIELPKCEKGARSSHELRNLHTLALVMARAAVAREESRGGHYRSDFPFRNDEDFAKHSASQKNKDVRFEV